MSASLWRLHYHIVWATKNREALIQSSQEANLFDYVQHRSSEFRCIVHAVNGMCDHIHVVVSIPPTIAVSEYIRKIKAGSSTFLNKISTEKFAWQRGYGVFSISQNNLSSAIDYVNRQKEHHRNNSTVKIFERTQR